jgi:hypothetical protein
MFAVLLVPVYISDVHDVHEFIDKSSAEPGWVLHECCVRWGRLDCSFIFHGCVRFKKLKLLRARTLRFLKS